MKRGFFILTILFYLTGCTSAPSSVNYRNIKELDREIILTESGGIMIDNNTKLEFFAGTSTILWNGNSIKLTHPVISIEPGKGGRSDFFLHQYDFENILLPLLTLPHPKILIDPGHGGEDPGAVGKFSREKELNLTVALLLAKKLSANGFEVALTRSDDVFIPLNTRGEMAASVGADLFISIHHNASLDPSSTGVETYYITPLEAPENDGREETAGHRYQASSFILACLVQNEYDKVNFKPDRGIKYARFRVLTLAECPAILTELGFISNPEEELIINSAERQNLAAECLAQAVLKFFTVSVKSDGAINSEK